MLLKRTAIQHQRISNMHEQRASLGTCICINTALQCYDLTEQVHSITSRQNGQHTRGKKAGSISRKDLNKGKLQVCKRLTLLESTMGFDCDTSASGICRSGNSSSRAVCRSFRLCVSAWHRMYRPCKVKKQSCNKLNS